MNPENEERQFKYQGIVICSASAHFQDKETDLVLLLKSQKERIAEPNQIYGVSKDAFLPPHIERNFDFIDEAKNIERRFAIPLKFGDIVQWNDCDCDHVKKRIYRFGREKPIFEVSSNANGYLLKIGGVIEPKKPTTFWTPFDNVTIPVNEATRAEPDVWLFAWIKFETRMRSALDPYHLELSFEKFISCDPTLQGRVSEAPWHCYCPNSKFIAWDAEPSPCDEDEEIDILPRLDIFEPENKWAEFIRVQLGLFVGERLLICKVLPQYDFIIPLVKPIASTEDNGILLYPTVGEYFHFSAVWSNHHRSFLVTELIPVPVLRGHHTTSNGNLLVRVVPSSPKGLFIDSDSTLGLIDDPYHHLSLIEFHPACYDSLKVMVEVRAIRSIENKTVRYRIVRTISEDDAMQRFDKWLKTAEFVLGPIRGIVINKDTAISFKHPNVYFRLPSPMNIPIGCGIIFNGKRNFGVYSEINITSFRVDTEFSARKVIQNGEQAAFQILLKAVPDQPQLAVSDIMGLVDMRNLEPPKGAGKFYAWVRESPLVGDCRCACSIMEVFSMSMTVPDLNLPSSSTSTSTNKSSSSRNTPFGSYHGGSSGSRSSRSSTASISTKRFVGPGTSKADSSRSESAKTVTST